MSWQRIELNMIPDTKVLPVVHASQFDSNRSISFQMFTGEDEWTIPEGLTIELHCRKVDDNIVTLAPLSVDGSVITFITTEQLTACSGQNKCELSFIDADDLVIGSLNFILDVEPDPLKGGVTSETEIDNLTQQIEDIATEVIGEDYYDKTEVDALLNDKADVSDLPDMSLYYTKTATDTLLSAKADAATTYTKSETDSLLSAKANTADLATVATTGDYDDLINKPTIPANTSDLVNDSDFQNEMEVNNLILAALLAVMPVDSATGNPCTFDTDIATSLVGLSADIVASGGGGTPSTPIPIVGHSALNLDVNGDTFTVSFGQTVYGGEYDANRGKVKITWARVDLSTLSYSLASSASSPSGKIFRTSSITDIKSRARYEENPVKCEIYTSDSSWWYTSNVENYGMMVAGTDLFIRDDRYDADIPAFVSAMQGEYIYYELATPIEIDVSSISVEAVSGTNTITSDGGGNVTASYKVSIQKYIDDHV